MLKHSLTFAAIASLFGGCASHSHQLTPGSAAELLKGEFVHAQPSRLVLESAAHRYVAEGFVIHRQQNLAELRKRYRGTDPRHWERIFAGLDRDHETYSAEARAVARDGTELRCRLAWAAGQLPKGVCLDKANREFALGFD